ncbi:ABC transporter ATP-binding protein [Streptosporangium violaceochromogenes]|nr:ABC transporter ATP-binding protein [Streptosporangium violaceochromogenes]
MSVASIGEQPRARIGDPVLTFDNVSMTFPDGTEAFRDVSFELRAGEFITIVGPSGCGKSTILRVASGLEKPSSGMAARGTDNIGYVFQDPTLLPWRRVRANVELFAELHGHGATERRGLAEEALRLVGLEGFDRHYPRQLSGGMRMRVSLARSLTLRPRAFLFDEPFAALDEITRQRLNEEVIRLFQSESFGGLFITHSVFEAAFLSTRVLVMSKRPGTLVAEFPVPFTYPRTEELRFDPAFAELSREISGALKEAYR